LWRKQQNSGGKVVMHEALGSVEYFACTWCQIHYMQIP
jgi:hypothetical protein